MKQTKVGTKEHYFQVVNHMGELMDKTSEDRPDIMVDLKELFLGLQIINNEYVLKHNPIFGAEQSK